MFVEIDVKKERVKKYIWETPFEATEIIVILPYLSS